jgi:tripartite ATP-independent transporter DctM subunit
METTGALILIFVFVGLLAVGVPIALCIGLSTIAAMLLTAGPDIAVTTLAMRIVTGIDSFVLLAIPFFILAGEIMNRGGSARRIIDFAKALVGWLPGGLAFVNIVSAMIFGAISGSAVASASAIGGVMTPRMEKEGYERPFIAAVNITSATTGLIIPPSNILIVYSLAAGVSVAALFIAGYLPGIVVGLALMVVAAVVARRRGYPTSERVGFREALRLFLVALPSLGLIVVVIGGIIAGFFTATEAAAVAVLYALVLALAYREIPRADFPRIFRESASTTAVVMLLVGTSMGMSRLLTELDIPQTISAAVLGFSDNGFVILVLVNIILLGVGTFMDMTPAVLIFTPIFLPIAAQLGIDPTHFGIIMVFNLCIGLCTPPVGSVLFVGCGVARLPITRVIRPLMPFYLAMVCALFVITYWPWLSLALPHAFGFETNPVNP